MISITKSGKYSATTRLVENTTYFVSISHIFSKWTFCETVRCVDDALSCASPLLRL